MDPKGYLERLGIFKHVVPDVEHLRLLQQQHMSRVPFENIDIYYGVPIEYSLEAFYRKIVLRKRGGYCYELNGLFNWLLSSLGYDTALISGLVVGKKGFVSEFEHMATIVDIDGVKWLADVGFGDSSLMPIEIVPGKIQNDGHCDYRIMDDAVVDGKICMSLEKYNDKMQSFFPLYHFTLQRKALDYFMIMHEYQEVVPTAYYKGSLLCSLPTNDGRISIINNRLIETRNGSKKIRTIDNSEELARLFEDVFKVVITSENDSRLLSVLH